MRLAVALLVALLATPAPAAEFDHRPWDALLRSHVTVLRSGQASVVNYAGFAAARARLQRYLESLAEITPAEFDRWSSGEQLSCLINAYNAWTVWLVLEGYPRIESIKELGSVFSSPWKKKFVSLLGATRSLDDIEHGLIRGSGRFADPRIHFALNCASVGCPALRAEAYVATRLDTQLEEQTRQFLADRTRNRLEGGALRVSAIFNWYRQDFEKGWRGARNLISFLALYGDALGLTDDQHGQLVRGKLAVEFLDYDWRLNFAGAR